LVANSIASWADERLWSVYSVLWMQGAYLELVKLISARALATSRADYFTRVGGLRLVGGGFSEFDTLADQIDTIIEHCDPDDDGAVRAAAAEIRRLYAGVNWIPRPFRQVLEGKNHLPARKLRLSLFAGEESFLGSGAYHQHFFDGRGLKDLAGFYLRDQLRYSAPALQLRKLREYRKSVTRNV
jgi:FADH2 O2-dependent halogenase